MMYDGKITVYRDPYGDDWKISETSEDDISYETFKRSVRNHQIEVMMCMDFIASKISAAGMAHDFTKDSQSSMYFRDFLNWKINDVSMDEGEWFPMHIKAERHHLRKHVPDDVNLIDVIEMVCDCVCAALARSEDGTVRPLDLDGEMLKKAVQNTVELVREPCVVVGERGEDMG